MKIKDLTYIKQDLCGKVFKRLAIFASYSRNNLIAKDVVFYLQKMKEIVDAIVFVADNQIAEENFEKIKDLVIFAEFKKHGKYDFGSYQKGFLWCKDNYLLQNADEIIFCNDSVCGPYQPLKNIFEKKLLDGNPDFYGHTRNDIVIKKMIQTEYSVEVSEKNFHIQSYFFIVSKNIFSQDFFIEFMKNIEHLDDKNEIIARYEIGLSDLIISRKFSVGFYYEKPVRDFKMVFSKPENCIFCKKSYLNSYRSAIKTNRILRKYKYPFLYMNSEKLFPNTLYNYIYLYFWCKTRRIIEQVAHFVIKYLLKRN